PIAAFLATSSSRFFGSPTAALLCPDLDPPPACASGCSRRATAWLLAPGSRPSRRTSLSRRRSCAWTRRLPAPHPPPCAQPPVASALRSSVLPCACSPTSLVPLPFVRNHIRLRAVSGEQTKGTGGSNPSPSART